MLAHVDISYEMEPRDANNTDTDNYNANDTAALAHTVGEFVHEETNIPIVDGNFIAAATANGVAEKGAPTIANATGAFKKEAYASDKRGIMDESVWPADENEEVNDKDNYADGNPGNIGQVYGNEEDSGDDVNANDSVNATIQFEDSTLVPDRAFRLGVGSGISAYHFIATATAESKREGVAGGITDRDASAVHTQAFYIVGPEQPTL